MKGICFNCHFVGVGVTDPRCPVCAFPLIVNTEPVALATHDLEKLFHANRAPVKAKAPPLPGVSEEPRSAQILVERRRQRAAAILAARKAAARRAYRRRLVAHFSAAAALVAGIIVGLNAVL